MGFEPTTSKLQNNENDNPLSPLGHCAFTAQISKFYEYNESIYSIHLQPSGLCKDTCFMNSMKMSFRYMLYHDTKTPNDAVTPQHQSQFTPKMKTNAIPHLLSSLV